MTPVTPGNILRHELIGLVQFSLPRGEVEVRGSALVGRPEDRVKRNLRRRW